MKSFFNCIGKALVGIFTSKRFLVAAGGAVVAVAKGVPIGTAALAAGGSYVLSQGMADFGKNATTPPTP